MTDLAIRQMEHMQDASDSVVGLEEVVDYISQHMQQAISKATYNVTQSLAIANALISDLSANLNNITGRMEGLHDAMDTVEKLSTSLEPLHNLLSGDWAGLHSLFDTAKAFCMYAVFIGLLSAGIWRKFMGIIGTGCAAIATGLAFAYIFTFQYDPTDAARSAAKHLPSALQVTIFVGISAAVTVLYTIYGCIARRRATQQTQGLVAYTEDVKTSGLWFNNPKNFTKLAGRKTSAV